MQIARISKPDRQLRGTLQLEGSKSISNRTLIVLALAGAAPAHWLRNLSPSRDTDTLLRLLAQPPGAAHYDAGDAGTTYRFLTAYLSLQPGTQVLTGSTRMLERPIGPLVEALQSLGADITYLGQAGYPPLRIGPPDLPDQQAHIRIEAGTSSQFLSALLLIAPYLPQGLVLEPVGKLVSRAYLDMTLALMRHFGAQAVWQGANIVVQPGRYTPRLFTVEADWSAASYWYAMAALADSVELRLRGLAADSLQGDAVLAPLFSEFFGVKTVFETSGIVLHKSDTAPQAALEFDFLSCPDIAQTVAVAAAGLGMPALFQGLETLAIKETDRTLALQQELAKVGCSFAAAADGFPEMAEAAAYRLNGKAAWEAPPRFATYGDHRMAMALAPLALLGPIELENPNVVRKSYGSFWEHLQAVGFEVKMLP